MDEKFQIFSTENILLLYGNEVEVDEEEEEEEEE